MSLSNRCCPTGLDYADGTLTLTYTDCCEEQTLSTQISELGSGCLLDRVELGRMGPVTTDTASANEQPAVPVMQLAGSEIVDAVAWVGTPGTTDTDFEIYEIDHLGAASIVGAGFTMLAGDRFLDMSAIVGNTFSSPTALALLVTQGSDALDLNVALWLQVCLEEPPPD